MDIQKILETRQNMLDLGDIEDSPGPYCMSFGFDIEPLTRSIGSVGLINAPLLIEKGEGGHTVIAGYRRIRALKAMDYEKIPCRILQGSQLSPLECLLLNLYDNLATRKLNEVEKGMVLKRLASRVAPEEILRHYMPLLGLPSHEPTLLFYLRLERELEEDIKICLVQGNISVQVIRRLLDVDQEDREAIFEWISRLRLNFNQQNQFVDYIIHLGQINSISVTDFLLKHPLEKIISDERLNNPQKAKAILRFLKGMRFPSLVRSEETFRRNVARLGIPKGVRIDPPPYFESPHYRLEVLFKDGRELREKMEQLSSKGGLDELGDPWEKGA